MARVLAAEYGARLLHHRLDIGVAHSGAHRHSPRRPDRLGDRPAADQVVHHRRPRLPPQEPAGHDGRDRAPRQRPQGVVHEERTVGVAVEGHPQIGAVAAHEGLQVAQVLGPQRVRMVMGETAVGLEVQADELGGEPLEHPGDGHPGHPVAAVGGHSEPGHRRAVDYGEQMPNIALEHVQAAHVPGGPGGRRGLGGQATHVFEAGVGPHRRRPRQAELEPVPARGVVGGGHHGPRLAEGAGGVVHHVGGDHPQVVHGHPLPGDPGDEGRGQAGRGEPAVPPDGDALGLTEGGERGTDAPRRLLVELLGHQPAHVVGLEDRV